MNQYDRVKHFYGKLAGHEWEKLHSSHYERLVFDLHLLFLRPYLGPGKTVLDAGCGGGRFSVEVAKTGSSVTLVDASPDQLAVAKASMLASGLEDRVVACFCADVCDLHALPDAQFDTTLCLGGVLNYLFERTNDAVRELKRVTKRGGAVIISVLSRFGALRFSMANQAVDIGQLAQQALGIVETGDDGPHSTTSRPGRHLFTRDELLSVLDQNGLGDATLRSIPALSGGLCSRLQLIPEGSKAWTQILELEQRASRVPSLQDSGEFLIAEVGRVE